MRKYKVVLRDVDKKSKTDIVEAESWFEGGSYTYFQKQLGNSRERISVVAYPTITVVSIKLIEE